jgi:hypothetical protein
MKLIPPNRLELSLRIPARIVAKIIRRERKLPKILTRPGDPVLNCVHVLGHFRNAPMLRCASYLSSQGIHMLGRCSTANTGHGRMRERVRKLPQVAAWREACFDSQMASSAPRLFAPLGPPPAAPKSVPKPTPPGDRPGSDSLPREVKQSILDFDAVEDARAISVCEICACLRIDGSIDSQGVCNKCRCQAETDRKKRNPPECPLWSRENNMVFRPGDRALSHVPDFHVQCRGFSKAYASSKRTALPKCRATWTCTTSSSVCCR